MQHTFSKVCVYLLVYLLVYLQELSSSQKSGGNLLQMLYDKPSRWSYTFQVTHLAPSPTIAALCVRHMCTCLK